MSDEISLEGKEYISSKRASELSGYAQDYIGQLARAGHIDARRIGGLWYISMQSLQGYKGQAETYKPQPPERIQQIDPDSLVSFDGKDYISAARAAKVTGYHQDYVGQLARSGAIISRQVGNRWYVQREALLQHKKEKDALLGAVQSQSVGIVRHDVAGIVQEKQSAPIIGYEEPYLTYTRDDAELFPTLSTPQIVHSEASSEEDLLEDPRDSRGNPIPIRVVEREKVLRHIPHARPTAPVRKNPKKAIVYGTLAGAALTVVIVLSFGFSTLKNSSTYAINSLGQSSPVSKNALTASAASAFARVGDVLERWLVPELVYRRTQ